jgi:hypothetical protein
MKIVRLQVLQLNMMILMYVTLLLSTYTGNHNEQVISNEDERWDYKVTLYESQR